MKQDFFFLQNFYIGMTPINIGFLSIAIFFIILTIGIYCKSDTAKQDLQKAFTNHNKLTDEELQAIETGEIVLEPINNKREIITACIGLSVFALFVVCDTFLDKFLKNASNNCQLILNMPPQFIDLLFFYAILVMSTMLFWFGSIKPSYVKSLQTGYGYTGKRHLNNNVLKKIAIDEVKKMHTKRKFILFAFIPLFCTAIVFIKVDIPQQGISSINKSYLQQCHDKKNKKSTN